MKRDDALRSVGAQAAIAAAVLAAAAMLVVAPMRSDLGAARVRLDTLRREAEKNLRSDPAGYSRSDAESLKKRADAIRERSAAGADAPALHQQILSLALRENVVIERMDPRAIDRKKSGPRGGLGFTIGVRGSYDALIRLLDAIERETGFTAVTAVRLAPATGEAGEKTVRGTIETTHRVFISDASAAAEGSP